MKQAEKAERLEQKISEMPEFVPAESVDSDFRLQDIETPQASVEPVEDDSDLDDDFLEAKRNIKQIARQGSSVVDGLVALAKESESPRAYEVLSTTLKQLTDINASVLDLHKKKKDIQKEQAKEGGSSGGPKTQNNAIFVGSTKELQDFLNGQRNG